MIEDPGDIQFQRSAGRVLKLRQGENAVFDMAPEIVKDGRGDKDVIRAEGGDVIAESLVKSRVFRPFREGRQEKMARRVFRVKFFYYIVNSKSL